MADVLMFSDFRLPGGTSYSNAEEIESQHRMGLQTRLVQLDSVLSAYALGLNPRHRGVAPRRPGGPGADARRARWHGGTVAIVQWAWEQLGAIDVDHVVVVVYATPVDWLGRERWTGLRCCTRSR